MAGDAAALWLLELVDVDEAVAGAGDDLVPLDSLDVAQVVVVHYPHASLKDVWKQDFIKNQNIPNSEIRRIGQRNEMITR